jgi:hypothetical protein
LTKKITLFNRSTHLPSLTDSFLHHQPPLKATTSIRDNHMMSHQSLVDTSSHHQSTSCAPLPALSQVQGFGKDPLVATEDSRIAENARLREPLTDVVGIGAAAISRYKNNGHFTFDQSLNAAFPPAKSTFRPALLQPMLNQNGEKKVLNLRSSDLRHHGGSGRIAKGSLVALRTKHRDDHMQPVLRGNNRRPLPTLLGGITIQAVTYQPHPSKHNSRQYLNSITASTTNRISPV